MDTLKCLCSEGTICKDVWQSREKHRGESVPSKTCHEILSGVRGVYQDFGNSGTAATQQRCVGLQDLVNQGTACSPKVQFQIS